jgi:signal transduction histidine kinase
MKTLHELFNRNNGFLFSLDERGVVVDHLLSTALKSILPVEISNGKTKLIEVFPDLSSLHDWSLNSNENDPQNELISLGKNEFYVITDFVSRGIFGFQIFNYTRAQSKTSDFSEAHRLLQMKTNFINVVSHELRTPLAGIQSSLDLLRLRFANQLPLEVFEYLSKIELQTARMSQMMRDVIDMNRLGLNDSEIEVSELDVRQQLIEIVDYLLSTKHMKRKVSFHLPPAALKVNTDERAFSTMFTNLIDNALKFSPKGKVQVHLEEWNDGCHIKVIDNGVGIPLEDQKRLFESFFRGSNANSFEGTGLGLVIVKRYTELLGGEIEVKSNTGHTEITVYLPDLATQDPPTLNTLGNAK